MRIVNGARGWYNGKNGTGGGRVILTVTCNPALDCEMELGALAQSATNRARTQTLRAGGKGLNVSFVLRELGLDSVATGFAAGFTGDALESEARRMGIQADFVRLASGLTRVNVKLMAGGVETEINAPGCAPDKAACAALAEKVSALRAGDVLVLAGSVPPGAGDDFYASLLAPLAGRGVLTAVDASGAPLKNALAQRPFLVKPNLAELGQLAGRALHTETDVLGAACGVRALGARNVLVSLGADGSLLLDETGTAHRMGAPRGALRGSVGAGDSMVAGFLAGWLERGDYGWAQRLGTAAGAATAFSDGLARADAIRALLNVF